MLSASEPEPTDLLTDVLPVCLMVGLMIVVLILRARAGYFQWKLWKYIRANYPEKEAEFGCKKRGWLNEFALVRALWKEHGIDDLEFVRLRNSTKGAWAALLVLVVGAVLVMISCIVVLFVVRS